MEFEYDEPKKSVKQNTTGIPDGMKKRFESFSAMSFDDVRVHYNSKEPAKLNALAYTQGTQVYIAPGQEKYLSHELGHVVQQKQGRVRATGRINGVEVNEDTALETEADNFLAVGYRYNKTAVKDTNVMEGPVQMVKGEADSIFDFEKLKEFIRRLVHKNSRERQAWIGLELENLSDDELDSYTERVQTLLEDIRQVDLQFLAVMVASFEEEGLLDDETSFENLLNSGERRDFGPKADLQNKYRNIIKQKLDYMKMIKAQLETQCSEERMNIQRKYLSDIEKQIKILETIFDDKEEGEERERGKERGYIYNLNALLMETDEKIKVYMAIVAPSRIDRFKDISLSSEGGLISYSKQMQLGIGTPVRSFSWYLKYLMDPTAVANVTPLIRCIDILANSLDNWFQNSVSEALKNNNDTAPMNEDQKVPNQFGTPAASNEFTELLRDSLGLTTIGEAASIPERLREGSGNFEELDRFKEDIGFTRVRDGVVTPTEVHFLDFEHTAFHSIKENGSPSLYSPENAKKTLLEYNELMDSFIAIVGKDEYIENIQRMGMMKNTLSYDKITDKITIMLEANHCLPPNRKYDLHGNSMEVLETEKSFASDYMGSININNNGKMLLKLTRERYKLWYDPIEKEFNDIIGGLNPRMPQREKNRRIEYAKTQVKNKIYLVVSNGGILYELQELEILSGNNIFKKLPSLNIEDFFKALEEVFKKGQAGKLHVIAFCFKLIRLIKENNPEPGEHSNEAQNANKLEKDLFAERISGDYFDVLNHHDHKQIVIGGEQISIPFDKMTSTGRFKPKAGTPKHESIPFIGGASGTTRDISRDLLSKGMLKNEKEYWKFQMINASFMILYSYHSFIEVMYRAATTRIEYYGEEVISKYVIDYLRQLTYLSQMPDNKDIIEDIKRIINKKCKIKISKYKKDNRQRRGDNRKGRERKQSRQNKRNRLLRESGIFDNY